MQKYTLLEKLCLAYFFKSDEKIASFKKQKTSHCEFFKNAGCDVFEFFIT